jgi:hypothetical protein
VLLRTAARSAAGLAVAIGSIAGPAAVAAATPTPASLHGPGISSSAAAAKGSWASGYTGPQVHAMWADDCAGQSCSDSHTAPTTVTSDSAPSALPAASAVACVHDLKIGTNRTYPHQIGVNDKVSCTETGTVFNFTYTWWQRKNPNRKGGWKKITSVNYGGPYIWPVSGYWESGWQWKGCKKGWEVHVQETGTVYFSNFGPARVDDNTDNETCP